MAQGPLCACASRPQISIEKVCEGRAEAWRKFREKRTDSEFSAARMNECQNYLSQKQCVDSILRREIIEVKFFFWSFHKNGDLNGCEVGILVLRPQRGKRKPAPRGAGPEVGAKIARVSLAKLEAKNGPGKRGLCSGIRN